LNTRFRKKPRNKKVGKKKKGGQVRGGVSVRGRKKKADKGLHGVSGGIGKFPSHRKVF